MADVAALTRAPDVLALERWLDETPSHDVAAELAHLDAPGCAVVIRLLPRERALTVFEALEPAHQERVLEGLRDTGFRDLIEDMQPDDRARLVGELPAKVAKRVLSGLSAQARAKTAALLGYPEESAGRVMTPDHVSLRASSTVAEAMAKVRRVRPGADTVYSLPVTDDERHLVGIVSLHQLVLADPTDLVSDLCRSEVHHVSVYDDREVAARLIQRADLLALPVLDTEDRLVGVMTVDDAMEILEAEETEDREMLGAVQPLGRPYLAISVLGLARSRAVWLLVLIIAAAMTVNVLQFFETTLEQVVTLTLFIPLLIDTGGNAGSQAATVVIRAMTLSEVRQADWRRLLWREARVGLILGAVLGAAAFVPMLVLFDADLALIISATLVVICTWATFAGAMLPLLARRLGIDPAVVSAPLITTLVDASGLIVYFLIARMVLGL